MCDRLVKTHRMEMTFLCVWDQSFHILKCTGDLCLTVSLHNRHINQEVHLFDTAADLEFQSSAVFCKAFVLLGIMKFHIIAITYLLITAHLKYI